MKIKKLYTQNIKRIKAVTIEPTSNIVAIAGNNEQGKSSLIDSIIYALGGKATMPENPIRDGEQYAQTVIDLGELIAIREYERTDNGFKHTLKLQSKNGNIISSPQGELDRIYGELTFDPIAFERLKEKDQYELLSKLVGYDETKYLLAIESLMSERKNVGRERDKTKAIFDKMIVDPDWYSLPDEETSITELLNKNTARDTILNKKFKIETTNLNLNKDMKDKRLLISDLQERIINLKNDISKIEFSINENVIECNHLDEELKQFDGLEEQLKNVELLNAKVKTKRKYSELENTLGEQVEEYGRYTQLIEETRANQKKAIEELQMPLELLELKEGKVYYKGFPYSECSGAERLTVALTIAEKLNRELNIALIKDGAILDDEHLEYIKQWANDKDIQVWIEVIDKDKSEIIIEDGELLNESAKELV